MLVRMWRKVNLCTLLVGATVVQPLRKIVWMFIKKIKIELTCDPAIKLLGICLKQTNKQTTKKLI